MLKKPGCGIAGFGHGIEGQNDERGVPWPRNQPNARLAEHRQGAFRGRQQRRQVESLSRRVALLLQVPDGRRGWGVAGEVVESIARGSTPGPWPVRRDRLGIPLLQAQAGGVDSAFQRVGLRPPLGLIFFDRGECRPRAIAKNRIYADQIVGRHAVLNRMCAGSVVGDHAPKGRPVGGGWIRSVHEAILLGFHVERTANHARFDLSRAPFNINLQDSVQVARAVNNKR